MYFGDLMVISVSQEPMSDSKDVDLKHFSDFFPAETLNREDGNSAVMSDKDNYRLLYFYY